MSETHAETVAYVRDTMLPEAAPPASQTGVVRWLRENLFSGFFNTILTLIGVAIIWFLLSHFGGWFMRSVWNADSIAQCRQIVAERWGQGETGACFAVIRVWWKQFMFGFYPASEYWRPVAALALLMLALAPILFSEARRLRWGILAVSTVVGFVLCGILGAPDKALLVLAIVFVVVAALIEYQPGRALIYSALFPFIGIWLLWGGSIWTMVSLLFGVVLGLAVWRILGRFRVGIAAPILGLLVAVLWWYFLDHDAARDLQNLLPAALPRVESQAFGGFLLAITIGVSAITLSLPLGIVLALARNSKLPVVKTLAVIFIEFIRGVPLITLLFVAWLLLNYFLPAGTSFDIVLRVIIMVTFFASAYVAEVIRGGLAALPKGQYEAADSLGLDYWKAQRLIVLPQALKISIPGIVGTFIGMFKDTTLVAFVALFDPLKQIPDAVRANFAWKGAYWEPYIFTASIFFIICFSMSRYAMWLERQLKREHR